MSVDWENVVGRLKAYPADVHNFLPPCPEESLEAVQKELGRIPDELTDMLRHFNGAELFVKAGPLITIFGITPVIPLSRFEWAPDWVIDKYTPEWRHASPGRDREWAIGMMCYGGLIILDQDGMIKEWETSQARWGSTNLSFCAWIDGVLAEGSVYMKET